MSDDLRYRIGELFGEERACDFLSIEEIESLMNRNLDPARRVAFETHAASCAECDSLLDDLAHFGKIESHGLLPREMRAFRKSDERVRLKLGLESPSRSRFRLLFWSLIPTAAVLALVLFSQLQPSHPLLIESVPAVPLKPPPVVRGPDMSEVWSEAADAWERDDMAAAVRALEPAVAARPDDPALRFYLGLARLRTGDAAAAVEDLRTADRLENPPSETIRWILAAALERASRFEEACAVLRELAESGGARAGEADRIVSERCDSAR
jgi:cytochrome c-type biogenesis protein CcmH/NrfG